MEIWMQKQYQAMQEYLKWFDWNTDVKWTEIMRAASFFKFWIRGNQMRPFLEILENYSNLLGFLRQTRFAGTFLKKKFENLFDSSPENVYYQHVWFCVQHYKRRKFVRVNLISRHICFFTLDAFKIILNKSRHRMNFH